MSKVKIGIVGLGYLGKFHFEKFKNFTDVEIAAVCDINEKNFKKVDKNVLKVLDYRKLLPHVDAVSIVTPTNTHYEIAKFFLENKIDVLLEKPICSSVEEAKILNEIAYKNNCIFQIGHLEEFNPAVIACKKYIENPMFIESIRISPFTGRSTDIDVIRDLMIHDIEIMLNFIKNEVKFIHAAGAPVITDKADIANVRIVFKNGCTANFTASRISLKKERKMRFFQKNRYISIDFDKKYAKMYSLNKKDGEKIKVVDFLTKFKYKKLKFPEKVDQLQEEIKSFIECVKMRKKPVVDGYAGQKALELSLMILKNLEENLNDTIYRYQQRD